MVRPVADEPGTLRQYLTYVVLPSKTRLSTAARQALICTITAFVTIYYATPEPALATYIVFFLGRPDRARSLLLDLVLIVVATLVIGLLFGLVNLVLDNAPWRVASMTVVSFALLFLVSASKLRAVGGTIALVIAYGLDLLGSSPVGEAATRGLLYGWLFVGVPAGVSVVVNLLLAPSPRDLVQRALAGRLIAAASTLRDPTPIELERVRRVLRESEAEMQALLRLAGIERVSPAGDLACLSAAADNSVALLLAIEFACTAPDAELPKEVREFLARTLDEMAYILHDGGYPVEISIDRSLNTSLSPMATTALNKILDALEHFADCARPHADADADAPVEEASGFLVPDAFTNPDHVRYALKTTGAAMACYLIYSLLSWPGIHTSLITCYIVSLSTLGESFEKLTLRIVGCLLGAAGGLAVMIFVIPSITTLASYLLIVFTGAFLGSWVAVGSARISYAGFQFAFAFFVCVIQGAGPSFDMLLARDRIIGILLGNAVAYLVFAHIWPVSIGHKVELGLKAAASNLSRMLTATGTGSRNRYAARNQMSLLEVEANLELTRYEPAQVRPPQRWQRGHAHLTREIAALAGPLLLFADREDPVAGEMAQRLERLGVASPGEAQSERPANTRTADGAVEPLRALVQSQIDQLEDAWRPLTCTEGTGHA